MNESKSRSPSNYEVGYAKPPRPKRFPKGRSGNPRGRPPGGENIIAVFKRLALQKQRVRVGDKTRLMTRLEAILLANMHAALRDSSAAMNNLMRLAELQGEFSDRTDPAVVGKPIAVPEKVTMEEYMFCSKYARPGMDLSELYDAILNDRPFREPSPKKLGD